MHGRDCTTSTQLSTILIWNIDWMLDSPQGRRILIWGVGLRINSECGLSQLIYNQGCLLFWNLWCFVRFVFHKYFPKNLNIIITKPFYSGAKRMNNFPIAQFPFVKVLTSWQIHQILLRSWQFFRNHCKLLQFSITTWSDQVAFLFQNTLSVWILGWCDLLSCSPHAAEYE